VVGLGDNFFFLEKFLMINKLGPISPFTCETSLPKRLWRLSPPKLTPLTIENLMKPTPWETFKLCYFNFGPELLFVGLC